MLKDLAKNSRYCQGINTLNYQSILFEDMHLHTAKQEALAIIQRLPDTADMEEIMYRLYVLENIRRGQKDSELDKTTSSEQVLRDIQSW